MATISQSTIDFFETNGRNNNKEWFQSNKKDCEKAKDNFTEFLSDLHHEISEKENSQRHFAQSRISDRNFKGISNGIAFHEIYGPCNA